jgi:hypothetical protein
MAGGGATLAAAAAAWEIAVVFVLRPLLAFAFFPLVQEIAGFRRKTAAASSGFTGPWTRGESSIATSLLLSFFFLQLDVFRRTAVVKQQPREIQKSTNTLSMTWCSLGSCKQWIT